MPLSIGLLETYFSEISNKMTKFSSKKIHLKCCLQNVGNFGQDSPAASKIVRMTIYNVVSNEITFKMTMFSFQYFDWNLSAEFKHQSLLCVPALCCGQVS